ncbi:33675_t:CDS:2 [Racocetra persica]|uniref:33675_t:CDS:1 n=1 Tax=Racocetra persica TaxID=160502 RepID=A0ACA9RDB9_9GLOM|nr:33675_t:CDS:2 [Racocetra persica]
MPYKDINQQREKSRLAMRKLRAKQKGLTPEEITRLTTDGEVQSEIQQTQQNFLTAMENLIRQELGKFSPPSGLKTPKPTPARPKSAASPEKIKVDIAALEKSTGLKSDWRRNSPEQEIYRAFREEENEEEIYRRDMRLANQDQERQKEIEFWDKVQNQDNTELKENDDE